MEHFNIDIMELILKNLSYQDAENFINVFPEADRAIKISSNIQDIINDNTLINIENGWEKLLFDILKNYNICKITIDKYLIRVFYKEGIVIHLNYTQTIDLKNEFKLNIYYYSSKLLRVSNILSFHKYDLKYSALENTYICTCIGNNKLLSYTTINNGFITKDIALKSKHFFTESIHKNIKNNYLNFTRKLIKKCNNLWYYELIYSYYNCLKLLYDVLTPLSINDEIIEEYSLFDSERKIYTRIHEHISLLHIDVNIRLLLSILYHGDNDDYSNDIKYNIYDKDIEIEIKC